MDNPNEIIVDGEIAYRYIYNPYYYITKSGTLYSTYIKGAQGKSDISKIRKVAYGEDKDGYYRVVLSLNGEHTSWFAIRSKLQWYSIINNIYKAYKK